MIETPLSYSWAYALSKPELQAQLKLEPSDFQVVEKVGFEFSGEGEHQCIFVEKIGLNTNDVARTLSRHFNVSPRDISYGGLKDRQAITRQWFSLRVGLNRHLDLDSFEHPDIKILDQQRNSRKIKRGSHVGNQFRICLKNLMGDSSALEQRAQFIQEHGVPNYFGDQRFGKQNQNVEKALAMFSGDLTVKDRFLRGLYLSATRAFLFNQFLSKRVNNQSWTQYLQGDVMSLEGTASSFLAQQWDDELQQRLMSFDIHPSGPLWGKGDLKSIDLAKELELSVMEPFTQLCKGLEDYGLKQERRPLRLRPSNFKIYPEGNQQVVVEFGLSKGQYATTVLRELVSLY